MIKIIGKPIRYLKNKYEWFVAWYLNRERYLNGTISSTEYKMKKVLLNKSSLKNVVFYQSYPPLRISGIRGTCTRYSSYNMKEHLNKDKSVLDIGSHIGFFSAFISKFVKNIDAIEMLKEFVEIGNILIKDEDITNVNIINGSFEDLSESKKYDIIISCAVHDLVGDNKSRVMLSFDNHLNKMIKHLNKDGLILLESHGVYYNHGDNDLEERIKKNGKLEIIERGVSDDYEGTVREFFWLKEVVK